MGCLAAAMGEPLHTVADSGFAARSYEGDAWEQGWEFINGSATWQVHQDKPAVSSSTPAAPATLPEKELPDEPGPWFHNSGIFVVVKGPVLNFKSFDNDFIVQDQFWQSMSKLPKGGWQKAIPATDAAELKREVERLTRELGEAKDNAKATFQAARAWAALVNGLEAIRDLDTFDENTSDQQKLDAYIQAWIKKRDELTTALAKIKELEGQLATQPEPRR
jgi:hypothetical protein